MPTVPINIVNITAGAGITNSIVNGKIEGEIKAAVNVDASICHGLQLGITGQAAGKIAGNATLLFIGGKAQGQLTAEAGAKVLVRLEPNLYDKMGLTVEAGAYAFAAAAGSLALYLTPEYFARYIQDQLDDFTADLFLIFLEEVEAEIGVWGKVAVSAAAEGHLNIILDVQQLDAGFEISGGGNLGLEAGSGYDFYCQVGFKDLRRAVKRSTLRINEEIKRELLRSDLPQKELLAVAFDFAFPLVVLTAYDIGQESYQKKALIQPVALADITVRNFVDNLQRLAIDKLTESAIRWLSKVFAGMYHELAGIELSDAELEQLRHEIESAIELLGKGDFRIQDINGLVTHTVNIIDLLDGDRLDELKEPLTIFWLSGMLGLIARDLLADFYAGIGVSNSAFGGASIEVASEMLPNAPELVKVEVRRVLGNDVLEIGVGQAVDYLIAAGTTHILDRYTPEFRDLRKRMHTIFGISEGDLVADLLRILAGEGTLQQLSSYMAIKQLVKTELLDGLLLGELLPAIRQASDLDVLAEYLDEVVEPSIHTVSNFMFDKLDAILIDDLHQLSEEKILAMMDGLSTGCGIVVYQVLARNIVFFDDIITDFVLDNTYTGFRTLRQQLEDPAHPLFVSSRQLFEEQLPGNPDLSLHTEAFQTLLYDLASAGEEVFGPTIHTPQRRIQIKNLKRSILLSIGGSYDYATERMPDLLLEELIKCSHIPNLAAVQQLAAELTEISLESFRVFAQRIVPALGDFFLAITVSQLQAMHALLNQYIDGLLVAAEAAIRKYEELAEDIRENIRKVLSALEQLIADKRKIIEDHLNGNWKTLAKTAVKEKGEEIIRVNTPDGEAETAALQAFHASQWLVINPILDGAFLTLEASLDQFFDTLEGMVDSSVEAAEEFLTWQESVEEQLIADLENMVVIPAADTARIIVDTLFPTAVMEAIEAYLTAREETKALEAEAAEKEAELLLLEAEKAAKKEKLRENEHRSELRLEILNPEPDFPFIYPASVEIRIAMHNGSSEYINNPQSSRIQLMLNGRPVEITAQDWRFNELQERFELTRTFPAETFKGGANLLEVSWITGRNPDSVQRDVVVFLVDPTVVYPREYFQVGFEYDPVGHDIDHEFVQISYQGGESLEVTNWQLLDRAGHRYTLPELELQPGDQLKIYTGRNPGNDLTDADVEEKVLHMGRGKAIWNNRGDTLYLVNPDLVLAVFDTY